MPIQLQKAKLFTLNFCSLFSLWRIKNALFIFLFVLFNVSNYYSFAQQTFLERVSLYGGIGVAFVPGDAKLSVLKQPQNIFGSMRPALFLNPSVYYHFNDKLSVGLNFKYFNTFSDATKVRFHVIGTGVNLKYNFVSQDAGISPFVLLDLNVTNLNVIRPAEVQYTDSSSISNNGTGNNVQVIDNTTNVPKFDSHLPNFGFGVGAGFDFRISKKVKIQVLGQYNYNIIRDNALLKEYFSKNDNNLNYVTISVGVNYNFKKNTKNKRQNVNSLAGLRSNKKLIEKSRKAAMAQHKKNWDKLKADRTAKALANGNTNVNATGRNADDVGLKTDPNNLSGQKYNQLNSDKNANGLNSSDPNLKGTGKNADDVALKTDPNTIPKQKLHFISKEGLDPNNKFSVLGNVTGANVKGGDDVTLLVQDEKGNVVAKGKPNRNGQFAFRGLKPDNYSIALDKPNPNIKASAVSASEDPALNVVGSDFKKFNYQQLSGAGGSAGNVLVGRTVINGAGKAAQDVSMVLLDDKGNILARTKSNKDGSFAFKNLKADGNYQAVMEKPNPNIKASMIAGNVDPALKMDPDDFKLFPYQRLSGSQNMGTFVTGKTLGADGKPAADVDILLINDKGDVIAKAKTNAKGSYAFKNLKAENYQAVIDNPDPNIHATMNVANTDPSLKVSNTDFQKYNYSQIGSNKTPTNLVVGKLSMNGMNKNAQDVDVLLINDKGEVVGQTKANKNGSFTFKNLAAENYQVLVDNPDPNIKASVSVVNNDPNLQVSADEFKKFSYSKLSKDGGTNNIVVGRVNVGTSGKNPQDVGILLLNENGEVVGRTVASKDGSFAFKNLKAEGYQAVIEGGNAQISAEVRAVNNDAGLKVSGDSFKGFNFKALGADNVSQAMVVGSVNLNGVNLEGKDVGVLLLDENGNVVARTVVSKNGTFAFNKIKPGNYQAVLDTENPNLKSAMGVPIIDPDLKINPNEIYKYNAITKQEEKLAVTDKIVLSGILRTPDGKQASGDGAVMLINEKGEIVKETKANKDGTFNFHNLPAGNYQVVYQSPDGVKLNPKMNLFQDDPSKRTYPDLPGRVTNTHYFGPNEYKVNDKYKEELDKFVKYYKAHPNVKGIALNAYGDFSGSAELNIELTKKRAEEARKYLQSQGIPAEKLVVNPMGRSLRFSNKYNQTDPKLNRKIDIHVIE